MCNPASPFARKLEAFDARMHGWAEAKVGGWLRNVVSAADIVNETIVAVLPRHAELNACSEKELASYLRKAIESKVFGASAHFRRRRRDRRREVRLDQGTASLAETMTSRQAGPAELLAAQELRERIDRALARLPNDQATALVWRYESGLSHGEIAQRLDKSLDAVSGLLQRAKEALARDLADDACAS